MSWHLLQSGLELETLSLGLSPGTARMQAGSGPGRTLGWAVLRGFRAGLGSPCTLATRGRTRAHPPAGRGGSARRPDGRPARPIQPGSAGVAFALQAQALGCLLSSAPQLWPPRVRPRSPLRVSSWVPPEGQLLGLPQGSAPGCPPRVSSWVPPQGSALGDCPLGPGISQGGSGLCPYVLGGVWGATGGWRLPGGIVSVSLSHPSAGPSVL